MKKLFSAVYIFAAMLFAGSIFTGTALASSASAVTSSGFKLFNDNCQSCHQGGISGWVMGAPAVGDKEEWKSLAAKGVDALLATTLAGSGMMPAKGGCEACSEQQLQSAIEYMLKKSQ